MARRKKRSNTRNIFLAILCIFLVVSAIREQLKLSPEERTWHGQIFGIPYDFRMPTSERVRAAFWNEETSHIPVPSVFGVGWTINFYPLLNPREIQRLP